MLPAVYADCLTLPVRLNSNHNKEEFSYEFKHIFSNTYRNYVNEKTFGDEASITQCVWHTTC